ncbi:uncharacterized protein LOC119018695 isoform X2 [Acanthopagrus latus]|uniref:uncharacterized protein LOC119018695 isoform X2 n=1 Tax=Acanthopagrus latus TaxID=8177 RepID=UPI00187C544A|nr:uncharacterized protein LOC119018695 isoform X2 [Acanthopagrus latus]
MASTLVILLLPLLVSLASASHHYGATSTFTYKGKNPDGSHRIDVRSRETFTFCNHELNWYCYNGNCGSSTSYRRGTLDSSTNAPQYIGQWCETETVSTRRVTSDKPFNLKTSSCCWVQTRNGLNSWSQLTSVDLGTRSDTGKPNRSPDIAILPLLRVPQNCPRTYKLPSFDPDRDSVQCRYGNIRSVECSSCTSPSGFDLDQGSCTLNYLSAPADSRVYGFEMVVEDFPKRSISLTYDDGSRSYRAPLPVRAKRQATTTAAPTTSWWWWQTTTVPTTTSWWWQPTTTTAAPTTTTPTTTSWWWWQTTTVPTTTSWWWQPTTTTAAPTTTTPTTTSWWWWQTTTATPTTTTYTGANNPLSKLPLHFSFLVDPSAPSCQEGLYLPRLLPPTPANGVRIQAEINKELEIKVKAQASAATVIDIIISGPLNISKHRTTNGDFAIRWTPITDELGNYFSICFAVEAMAGSSIYQSEMRCVVVDVVDQIVKSYVSCSESAMTVEIEKSSFPRLSEDHLRLNDPTNTVCSLQRHSNSTHVVAVIPLNACGTQIEEDDDNLIFTNEITTIDRGTDVITRKHLLEVQVCCQYPKRGNVSQSFTVHRPNVTVWEKGYGKFTYGFEFYPDSTFRTMVDPNLYPLEYEIGSRVFMQIEATSSINNTELFVESCTAAPYDNPNSRPKYTIIENGCNVDSTIQRYTPDNQTQFKFSMEAFKFIGQNNQVYISCSVMMCEAGNPNTRCAQGCINSTQPGGHNIAKREVVTQTSRHLVSQGPLRLKRSAEGAESPVMNLNLNLNLVFIAGCLLAAVGMISAVVMYKTKMSKVKYQPLPTFES